MNKLMHILKLLLLQTVLYKLFHIHNAVNADFDFQDCRQFAAGHAGVQWQF